jgi:hypothetical protein
MIWQCTSCDRYVLALCVFEGSEEGAPEFKKREVFPSALGPGSKARALRGSTATAYRDEAWACLGAGRTRAAVVLARSSLQALCRRYLERSDWKGPFAAELGRMERALGETGLTLAQELKDLGNKTAHPDPSSPSAPTRRDAVKFLRALDKFMEYLEMLEANDGLEALHTG